MKKFSTRDIFGIFVSLGVGLVSVGAWRSFFDMTLLPDVNNTIAALLWYSFLGTLFLLGTVVWREKISRLAASVLLFLPSFLFIQTWFHLLFVVAAAMLAYLSTQLVQEEIEDRMRFRFFRNVRAGSFMFILGLSVALSSAYFASIRAESWEELVPRFSVGEGTATVVFQTVGYFYPHWKSLADEGMTVDAFLLNLKKEPQEQGSERVTLETQGATLPAFADFLRENISSEGVDGMMLVEELYLESGRRQVSELAGRPVSGDEKMSDIFSAALQHKIIAVLNGNQASSHVSPVIVPTVLSLLLFLTLIPVGSVLGFFWIALGLVLFRLSLFFGWIRLERVERAQETILP